MSTSELVMCESCGCEPFKYRCPGCFRRSCSLSCVKRHKLEHGCSGSRSKTSFVPINQFSDDLLYSDYNFLEEVGRHVDAAHRDRVHIQRQFRDSKGTQQRFHWLKREAAQRGIQLQLLAEGMSLHQSNSSRTLRAHGWQRNHQKGPIASKQWEIHWCVQLHFPQAAMKYHEENVAESMVLRELLDRYIHPTASDPIARHQLDQYVKARDDVHVLMEDNSQLAPHRYHKLDKQLSLCENFVGKTIIEYPWLIIVLGSRLTDYCLLDGPLGGEEKRGRLKKEDDRATPTTTLGQEHTVLVKKSLGESKNCSNGKQDTLALKLIAQCYSDSDEDNIMYDPYN